jgi:hypothetical protein
LNHWFLPFSLIFLALAGTALPFQTPPSGSCFVYPSPATGGSAWVVYDMPQSGSVDVRVYNEAGDLVLDVTGQQPAGVQETGMNISYLRNGVYLCRVLLTPDGGLTQALKLFEFSVVR